MAKYKLTVKYNDVCELSLESDIPDIIGSEFDQYVKSMLYKKEDWENFETNFKEAAKLEYGNLSKNDKENEADNAAKEPAETPIENQTDKEIDKETVKEDIKQEENDSAQNILATPDMELKDTECDIKCMDDALDFNESGNVVEKENDKNITVTVDETAKNEEAKDDTKKILNKTVKKAAKESLSVSFDEYIKDKNINSPLDEFVAGACYLDEISNIKEFSLKQINAKLYPAFGRLSNSEVIENAIERVLIEAVKSGSTTKYKINQNAWNYHNYDLVRH